MSGDDEWIRSLTEAQAVTADTPEGQVTYAAPHGLAHDQVVDPKEVRRIQMGEHMIKAALGAQCRRNRCTHDSDVVTWSLARKEDLGTQQERKNTWITSLLLLALDRRDGSSESETS